jgi:ABC-type phosphate transport system, permease component
MISKNEIKDAEDMEFDHIEEKQINSRLVKEKMFIGITWLFGLLVALPLIFILGFIVVKGFNVINWEFFTSLPKPPGEEGGGVSNAIIGSLQIVAVAAY